MNAVSPLQILQQYWGYNSFRLEQENIINSIRAGHDTIGLLPTGGGKSITYQVAGLALGGLTIVISPLIALMEDQVIALKRRGIRALALHSGTHSSMRNLNLENLRFGDYSFLYLSPERLQNSQILDILNQLPISLIAVDEAHCISQWGHDFRPAYRKIVVLRKLLPNTPILAVTATATPFVVEDIASNLQLNNPNLYSSSFARPGVQYAVLQECHPEQRLLYILSQSTDTAIIYVRNRLRTEQIAAYLREHQITALAYNAHLPPAERQKIQMTWMEGKTRVIVATNAFGMGIDKDDVRLVLHLGFPNSLEEYYQEAGRGGRDGKGALAILLYQENEIQKGRNRIAATDFKKEKILQFFSDLYSHCSYLPYIQNLHFYPLNLNDFATKYHWKKYQIAALLRLLQRFNNLSFQSSTTPEIALKITMQTHVLSTICEQDTNADIFYHYLQKYYYEALQQYVRIPIYRLLQLLHFSEQELNSFLLSAKNKGHVQYINLKDCIYLQFANSDVSLNSLQLDENNLSLIQQLKKERYEKMVTYLKENYRCRETLLREYFGEKLLPEESYCKRCDNCLHNG